MKISIIIPVYNVSKYLSNLLNIIQNQSYKNFEVIMIDDGSSDNSYQIMKTYAKKDQRFKAYTHKNVGPGLTRKEGFQKASGDLLFFVDSDDLLANEFVLEKINKIFLENEIDLLLFESQRIPYNGERNKVIAKGNFLQGIYDVSKLNDCIVEGSLWMKIFKKDKFREENFIDSNNYEDVYATYMYLNNCENFYYLEEVLYIVNRLDENRSLTKDMNLNKMIKTIDIIIKISKFSKLEKSIKLLGLNYYMTCVRKLLVSKENLKIKKELIKKLKSLRKTFDNEAINLCKEKFKTKALYIYLITRIFI